MSFTETVVLGGLAGFTIYVSLPFGRLQMLNDRARVGLAMFSVGVLAFLFVDVFEHAFMTDYGIKRADYIEAFMKSIKWANVEKRL